MHKHRCVGIELGLVPLPCLALSAWLLFSSCISLSLTVSKQFSFVNFALTQILTMATDDQKVKTPDSALLSVLQMYRNRLSYVMTGL